MAFGNGGAGRLLAIGTVSGALILWELGGETTASTASSPTLRQTHRRLGMARLPENAPVTTAAFNPSGVRLHAGTVSGILYAVDVPRGMARVAAGLFKSVAATFRAR